jgi:hypothetical protein
MNSDETVVIVDKTDDYGALVALYVVMVFVGVELLGPRVVLVGSDVFLETFDEGVDVALDLECTFVLIECDLLVFGPFPLSSFLAATFFGDPLPSL